MQWIFAPLLGLAWEPKWSRVYETFGEDPLVVSEMAFHVIHGIQQPEHVSNVTTTTPIIIPSKAAACAKHFIGYSIPKNGHDRSPSWIPTRHLFQYFVPPLKQVLLQQPRPRPHDSDEPRRIRNSNTTTTVTATANDHHHHSDYGIAMTVMESYTETDGVPNVANRFTLEYLLRHRLQFDGVLVTDFEEIYNLHQWHHIVSNHLQSVGYALQQGDTIDMSMIPFDNVGFAQAIVYAVRQKELSEERLNRSVQRILQLKEDLNMFDEEITMDNNPNLFAFNTSQTDRIQQALDMAHQGIVLAKNQNRKRSVADASSSSSSVLPLSSHTLQRKIFLTGPTAHSLSYQSGGWTWQWQGTPQTTTPTTNNSSSSSSSSWFTYGTTVYQALATAVESGGGGSGQLVYSCGVDIRGGQCQEDPNVMSGGSSDSFVDHIKDWIGLGEPDTSIQRAVEKAKGSDVVIVGMGEEAYAEKPGDIRSLALPPGQLDLVRALKAADRNRMVIVVYFGGRPRLLGDAVDNADAVLIGFLPGPSAGQAVVDILFGKVNPSGKLPLTYPKFDDGGGLPYFHSVSDQCTQGQGGDDEPLPHYQYVPCDVQWPFGHGLSYTSFSYSNLTLSSQSIHYVPFVEHPSHATSNDKSNKWSASVTVKNTGTRPGAEVVLFFTFDVSRHTTPEYKRLRYFQKVYLEVGEEATVRMDLMADDLKYIGPHDDTHWIMEDEQSFRVGVGASTDCRVDPTSQPLCSDVVTIETIENYVAACDVACDIWANSGCEKYYFSTTSSSCWDLCTAMPVKEGWGWNYVGCIESVVWGLQQRGNGDSHECAKLTLLCRNIFTTGLLDRFGQGDNYMIQSSSSSSSYTTHLAPESMAAVWVANLWDHRVLGHVVRTPRWISKRATQKSAERA